MTFDYVTAFKQGGYWSKYVADILQSKGIRCFAPDIQIATTTAEREHMTNTSKILFLTGTISR